MLTWLGADGQERLTSKSVLIVGCGGTGSACAALLARSGLGRIILVDPDVVSLTDLHRQILYDESDVEHLTAKVDAARRVLRRSNSLVDVEAVHARLGIDNAGSLVGRVDLVIDCSDNFETRMLINDLCLAHTVGWVHGACTGASGLVIPFRAGGEGCYRCIVDHIPTRVRQGAARTGIFGPAAGMVGCLEAAAAIRMLIVPESLVAGIVFFDMVSGTYETIRMRRKKDCPACAGGPRESMGALSGRESFDSESGTARIILAVPPDLATLRERLAATYRVEDTGASLRVRLPGREALFMPGGMAVVRPAEGLEPARLLVRDLLEG